MYFWKIFIERYNFQLNLLNIEEVLYKKKKNQLIPRSAGGGTD